jgi:MerR family transcriptional regulator, light-induced transcriptional regulator
MVDLLSGPDATVQRVSDDLPIRLPPVDAGAADRVAPATLSPELLAGLLADGDDELAAWTLRHAMAEAPRVEIYDGLLREAMQLVGDRWASGRWSVAEEHLASRTLLRALERVRPALGPESRIGPLAVLAGAAGEQHMIGLACLEQVLAEAGWTVANLGADVPPRDLARFVERNDVALVALSALAPERVDALADAIRAVREAAGDRSIAVIVGGQVTGVAELRPAIDADGIAGSLGEALAMAEQHRPRA